MKILIFWDQEEEKIWYYISEGNEPLPFYITPKKEEKKDDKDIDEKKIH